MKAPLADSSKHRKGRRPKSVAAEAVFSVASGNSYIPAASPTGDPWLDGEGSGGGGAGGMESALHVARRSGGFFDVSRR